MASVSAIEAPFRLIRVHGSFRIISASYQNSSYLKRNKSYIAEAFLVQKGPCHLRCNIRHRDIFFTFFAS